MLGMWRPNHNEIEEWSETKEKEFLRKENINPQINSEQWLQIYVFTDEHEILFVKFPIMFSKWPFKLVESKMCF